MAIFQDEAGNYFIGDDESNVQPLNSAAAEATGLDAALIGAGRTFSNIGENLGLMEPQPGSTEAMAQLRQARPYSTMAGEVAPMLAPLPGGVAAQAIGGAGMGWMGANPSEGVQNQQAILGGIGGGLGAMAGRIVDKITGVSKQYLPILGGPAKKAAELGDTSITPGEAFGSEMLKGLEAGIETLPGGKTGLGKTTRQRNFNDVVLKPFGLSKAYKSVGDDAVDEITENINTGFRAVEAQIPRMDIPADLADEIRAYGGGGIKTKQAMKTRNVEGYSAARGSDTPITNIDGESIMKIRSNMLKATKNSNEANQIHEAITALDELIEGVTPGLGKEWSDMRGLYKYYKALQPSITESGNVSRRMLSKRLGDWRPTGEIGAARDLTKALGSSDFLRPFGEPGTANQLASLLTAGAGGSLGFGAAGPVGAAAGVLASPLAGYGTGSLYRGLLQSSGRAPGSAAIGRGLLAAPDYLALEE